VAQIIVKIYLKEL